MMGNYGLHKVIGTYTKDYNENSTITDLNKIISHSNNIFFNLSGNEEKNKKNKMILDDYLIYYILTNTNIFYLAVVKNGLIDIDENFIFELFEDVEHQGIKKLTDKNGELSRVGKKNLKFCIEQNQGHIQKEKKSFLLTFFRDDKEKEQDNSKISLLSTQINDIQNDVKDGVKTLLSNANDIHEINEKSETIKNLSIEYGKDALILERKIKCRKITNKVILISIISIIISIIFYFIFR